MPLPKGVGGASGRVSATAAFSRANMAASRASRVVRGCARDLFPTGNGSGTDPAAIREGAVALEVNENKEYSDPLISTTGAATGAIQPDVPPRVKARVQRAVR